MAKEKKDFAGFVDGRSENKDGGYNTFKQRASDGYIDSSTLKVFNKDGKQVSGSADEAPQE